MIGIAVSGDETDKKSCSGSRIMMRYCIFIVIAEPERYIQAPRMTPEKVSKRR